MGWARASRRPSFFKTSTMPATELSGMLSEITPDGLNHAFFANSGSEANDTIVRMARRYWEVLGKPEKSIIISRDNAYHGSTLAAASLGGMDYMHGQGGLPIPGIHHIGQPDWYAEGGDMSPEDFGLKRAQELEAKIVELGADKVAAFIAEPVQGAGGVVVPPVHGQSPQAAQKRANERLLEEGGLCQRLRSAPCGVKDH